LTEKAGIFLNTNSLSEQDLAELDRLSRFPKKKLGSLSKYYAKKLEATSDEDEKSTITTRLTIVDLALDLKGSTFPNVSKKKLRSGKLREESPVTAKFVQGGAPGLKR
jgi:hypothetical protein